MTLKTASAIAMVLLGSAAGAWWVLSSNKPSASGSAAPGAAEPEAAEAPKGRHGGRLLSDGSFQLEVTIYERGVPPQFRVYAYEGGRPVDPSEVQLTIELHRLGGRVDVVRFRTEADYLRGDRTVDEPHSFDLKVAAQRRGRAHRWEYSQIEGRVELAPESITSSGIVVETARPVRMKQVLEVPGEVVLNADRVAHVVPRLSGVLIEVRHNQGARVRKGEVLAVIDSRELADAKREVIEATHRVEFARIAFEREEMLWKKKISSEEEYLAKRHAFEEARIAHQSARQQLRILGVPAAEIERLATNGSDRVGRYELRAPFNGTIIEKDAALGEAVKGDQVLFVVADLSTVWAEAAVPPLNQGSVRVGQKVAVRSDAVGVEVPATLTYLGPLIGEETRAAKARVVVDNRDGRWRPGLFVAVKVVTEEVPVPVAVKASGIQKWRDKDVVFAQFGKAFEVRPVELRRSDGEWVEVVAGLEAGQQYAAENSFVLKADLEKAGATHEH